MKKRLVVVSGVIALVVIIVLAVVSAGGAARSITVAQAASGTFAGDKVQVSGQVATGSFTLEQGGVNFALYDTADPTGARVQVRYEGTISATFGNEVSAIVTGRMGEDGVLYATTLVTKCPSKYESGVDALTVAQIKDYGSQIADKPVKVVALLAPSTLTTPGAAVRFSVCDEAAPTVLLDVQFDGALSDEVRDNIKLVVTGSMGADGIFHATDVALGA